MAERLLPQGRHVLVADGDTTQDGLLIAWVQQPDGWWGKVVVARDGEASVFMVQARRLRPCTETD